MISVEESVDHSVPHSTLQVPFIYCTTLLDNPTEQDNEWFWFTSQPINNDNTNKCIVYQTELYVLVETPFCVSSYTNRWHISSWFSLSFKLNLVLLMFPFFSDEKLIFAETHCCRWHNASHSEIYLALISLISTDELSAGKAGFNCVAGQSGVLVNGFILELKYNFALKSL